MSKDIRSAALAKGKWEEILLRSIIEIDNEGWLLRLAGIDQS